MPPAAPRKRALLIGITQYQWSHAYAPPFDLVGPAADVAALAAALQTHYGFDPSDLTLLTSAPGTPPERLPSGANIRWALEGLIATCGPDDPTLVYYSGHGSQWPDPSGEETDGQDEALVVYDSRDPQAAAAPQGDWLDTEQHAYYERLAAQTANLTVIYDCCHSATGTRADDAPPGLVARQLGTDLTPRPPLLRRAGEGDDLTPRPPLLRRAGESDDLTPRPSLRRREGEGDANAVPPIGTEVGVRSSSSPPSLGEGLGVGSGAPSPIRNPQSAIRNPQYVMLAACRADERAYEGTLAAADARWPEEQAAVGQTVGLFTYFLLRALRHAPAATYTDLLTLLRDGVSMKQATQHPQGEGPLDRQLFGGATRPVDWLPVAQMDNAGLLLGAGSARGLAPGSGIAVYPNPTATPDAPFGGETALGTATVTQVYPLVARATFDHPPSAVLPAHARALVVLPVYTGRQLRVAVGSRAGVPEDTVAGVAAAVAASPLLQIVAAGDAPDVTATVGPEAVTFAIHALGPDGYPLPTPAPALGPLPTDPANGLTPNSELRTQNLELLARFRDGLARHNPVAGVARALQARLWLPDGLPAGAGEPVLASFDQFSVVLTYAAPAGPPLYYSLLRFAADGSVQQLWPLPGAEASERLAPGQQWPPAGAEASYGFRVETTAAPPGDPPARDRVLLFAATAPLDLHSLVQEAFSGPAATRDARLRRPPADPTQGDWASSLLSYRIG
ncbi:MAG: caspase family protein [Chloroflexota bacterium]|nr:caspase family protein [Chloroflexota bacterium]